MSKKNKNKNKGGLSKTNVYELKDRIISILSRVPSNGINYKQLAKRLGIDGQAVRKELFSLINELKSKGLIIEVQPGKYKAKEVHGYVTGIVDLTSMGYGYVVTDEMEDDVFISDKNLHTALNGDKVKVHLFAKKKGAKIEGEVLQIIERARDSFVGTIEVLPNFAFLIPNNKNMPFDLFIPLSKLNGAKQGQKAIAKIVDWDPKSKNPVAEVVEVLGFPGEHETEIHAILAEFELPYKFPAEVEAEANNIPSEITKEDLKDRRDFRDVPTFTIDPADAKDFDDAISLKKLDNGNWEVGVHIADVTHYVKPGTIIEEEAKKRATSVYLVDRVVPMLPEKLSNELCSLNQNVDKLTFSAVFEMDEDANVINEWFGRTIINSDKRLSYQQAQETIDSGEGDMKEELLELNKLAQILRERRFKSGAISFDKTEVKFDLDDKGKPLAIHFCEHGTANELIEEFMLLANRRVAEYVGKELKKKPFVYRIHDKPDPEKITKFSEFISRFGLKLQVGEKGPLPKSLNKVLHAVQGKKEENIVENLAMRSMAKAIYSTDNIGHYGLAFKYYTHFTSPIRRYPDMMVHRLLASYLKKEAPANLKYEQLCDHSSNMERIATEAERASIKYKQVEFMSENIGKTFEGIISGVTEWGIYVELTENLCEGMIHIRNLDDDFYTYDEDNYQIIGRSTGKTYTLGDKISIEVMKADLEKKQLDFKLAPNPNKK